MTERSSSRQVLAGFALAALLAACGGGEPVQPETPLEEADSTLRAGISAHRRDQYQTALRLFSQSLVRYRSVDDVRGMTVALLNMADTALLLGEHARAEEFLDQVDHLMRDEPLPEFGSRRDYLRAHAASQAGELERAAEILAPLLAGGTGSDALDAAALILRADVAIEQRAEDAAGWVARASELDADEALMRARLARLRGDLFRMEGDVQRAHAAYGEALAAYRESQDRPGIAATREAWGRSLMREGSLEQAREHLDRALDIRLWMGDRAHSLALLDGLVEIARVRGNEERAAHLTRWSELLGGSTEMDWRTLRDQFNETRN